MLFSWLRWSFSLILELNLPPQKQRASLAGKTKHPRWAREISDELSHSSWTHWLCIHPLSCAYICDLHVYDTLHVTCGARSNRCLYSCLSLCMYVPLNIMHAWLCMHDECRWMWLDRYSQNHNHIAVFMCACKAVGCRRCTVWDFILGPSKWCPHEEDEKNRKEI